MVDRDRLLTNVMLYWLTGTAGSSSYVGYASDDRITRWTDVEGRGGHFAALEEPDLLVTDVREFFRGLR